MGEASNVQPINENVAQFISQAKMREFAELEANFTILEKRYEQMKEDLVFAMLDPACAQENGMLMITLETSERRSPAWKKEFIRVAGKDAAEEITENTEPTKVRRLRVEARPTIR